MNVDHRSCQIRSMAIIGVFFYLQSRLKPGRMLLVDTEEKKIIQDVELKMQIARSRPHSKWLKEQVIEHAFRQLVLFRSIVTNKLLLISNNDQMCFSNFTKCNNILNTLLCITIYELPNVKVNPFAFMLVEYVN
jgi:hypothetical protein